MQSVESGHCMLGIHGIQCTCLDETRAHARSTHLTWFCRRGTWTTSCQRYGTRTTTQAYYS